ncbi:hypothetical protein [Streptomyces sp. NPDC005828]|uniref:hypothetical protein n=1 Tax=Streptomyces sp. NPDC005828 TaxID=3157071 RepID=UPI003407BBD7
MAEATSDNGPDNSRTQGHASGRGPVFCAENLARIASEHRWVLAVCLGTVFVALPALAIVPVGVL